MGRKKKRVRKKSYNELNKRKRRESFEFVDEVQTSKRRKRDEDGRLSQEPDLCSVEITTKKKGQQKEYYTCNQPRPCSYHDSKKTQKIPEDVIRFDFDFNLKMIQSTNLTASGWGGVLTSSLIKGSGNLPSQVE